MSSKTQIVNLALGRIGVSKFLNNVDTEQHTIAATARTFFDDDRDYCLRDFPWPFASEYATLQLVAGSQSAPVNNDWTYSYRYPSECLYFRRLVTGDGRNNATPPAFRIGRDTQGKLIYTDEQNAQGEFTGIVTDTAEFDPIAVSMLAWKIAADLAPSLSRIKDMAMTCMQMYEIDKSKAHARALNESQQSDPVEAEAIRARA